MPHTFLGFSFAHLAYNNWPACSPKQPGKVIDLTIKKILKSIETNPTDLSLRP
jgi:hypothetical protein